MREHKLFWCLTPHFYTDAIHIGNHRQRWNEWRENIHFYSLHIPMALDLANRIASSRIEGWKAHSKYCRFLVKWRWLSRAYANGPLISTSWNKLQGEHFIAICCHFGVFNRRTLSLFLVLSLGFNLSNIKGGKILHKIFSIRLSALTMWWFDKNPWSISSKWRAKPCRDKNR